MFNVKLIVSELLFLGESVLMFEPCDDLVKEKECNMTCLTPDHSQTIDMKCNGTSRGICTVSFGCTSTDMGREGSTKTYLKIGSLSYSDSCSWTCSYGTNISSPREVKVQSKYYDM